MLHENIWVQKVTRFTPNPQIILLNGINPGLKFDIFKDPAASSFHLRFMVSFVFWLGVNKVQPYTTLLQLCFGTF